MRHVAVAAALAALAVAGVASAAPRVDSVVSPSPVTALGADGVRVAYAGADCRVRMWNRTTGTVVVLGRGPSCERTSTGTAVAAIAVAGTRALWSHYTGGNIREWSLWTATTTRRTPRRLAFETSDPEARAPVVVGEGDVSRLGDLLPYAVGRSVVVLRSTGARAFAWTAPAPVTALAAKDGRVAVAVARGDVHVLSADGRVLRVERFGAPPDAVRLAGGGVLVAQTGRSLEVRGTARAASYTLLTGIRLADAEGTHAVLVGRGAIRLLRLEDGSGRLVASGSGAALEGAWLAYADGRRVRARRV